MLICAMIYVGFFACICLAMLPGLVRERRWRAKRAAQQERYLLGRQIVDSVLINDDGAGMKLDWERIESVVGRM